jgi:hypothetical protein
MSCRNAVRIHSNELIDVSFGRCLDRPRVVSAVRRKFCLLGAADRRLLLKAARSLAAYRVALWVLSWRRVAAIRPSPSKSPASQVSIERLESAVRAASRAIPRCTCLTRALALHHLLSRAGYESSIYFGVAKTPARGFEAHAWVEHDGVTLLEQPE